MKQNTRLTLKIYWQHAGKYKITLFLAIFFVITAASINSLVPLYFKRFFDLLSVGGDVYSALIGVLIIIAVLELAQWIAWRISGFSAAYFQSRTMADLANTCFKHLHRHSFSFFNNNFVGSLVKKVNRFTRSFEGIADNFLWNILQLVVNLAIIIVILLVKNYKVGLIMLGWVIVFMIVNYFLTMYKLKYDIERSEADSEATGVLADTITNNSNVKLLNGYGREVKNFWNVNEKVRKITQFTWNLENTFDAVQTFLMIILEIGIFYIAINLWVDGKFTVGDFVLLQSYVLIVMMRIWNFGKVIRSLYRDLADAEEMMEIFEAPLEIEDVKNAKDLIVKKGKIEFEDVNFNYNKTRRILNKLNLEIKPGEKIALVGPSGAGKTTIIKLILRMHDVSSGKILIDGQRISRVSQESLWQNISYVPQDPILFHRSLMENIRYGQPTATDEQVMEASKLAYCHDFIVDFPEGYETHVGERGVKLSGGERQRVAIARAILKNAPILVLDEATSSLDSESEMLIQDALNYLMKGKTVIVIAHRLSTIMKMDRILVVHDGKVVESGKHSELLVKKDGIYKNLWQLQAGGFIQ